MMKHACIHFTDQDYFNLDSKTYDAYDKDIAMVEVFFRKSTVIQMGSQPRCVHLKNGNTRFKFGCFTVTDQKLKCM